MFQSTLPRRERLAMHLRYWPSRSNFNPRSREGSDEPRTPLSESYLLDFNPRSREGSDLPNVIKGKLIIYISIHAPAKGATRLTLVYCVGGGLFQSTLPRRERHFDAISKIYEYLFQSTLPRRERLKWYARRNT